MLVHGCQRVIVEVCRDLLEAGCIAVVPGVALEIRENLALTFRERHLLLHPSGILGSRRLPNNSRTDDSRRGPEVQASSSWIPPVGALGRLCAQAHERAKALET